MARVSHPRAHQLLRGAPEFREGRSLSSAGHLPLEACPQSAQPEGVCDLGAHAADHASLAPSCPHRAPLSVTAAVPSDLRQEPSAVTPRAGICAGGARQRASLPQTQSCELEIQFHRDDHLDAEPSFPETTGPRGPASRTRSSAFRIRSSASKTHSSPALPASRRQNRACPIPRRASCSTSRGPGQVPGRARRGRGPPRLRRCLVHDRQRRAGRRRLDGALTGWRTRHGVTRPTAP
jgi:hypothetical protein